MNVRHVMDTSECIGILKALSDETRMKIFGILREGKLCGCKILESLNITQPTLSHHMKVLCECGIVIAEKRMEMELLFHKLRKTERVDRLFGQYEMP